MSLLCGLVWSLAFIQTVVMAFATPAPLASRADSINKLDKRHSALSAVREAAVVYRCPISGLQARAFKWRARYGMKTGQVSMISLGNIDSWSHIDMVTNDYMVTWNHQYIKPFGGYCCMYIVTGTVVGAITGINISTNLIKGDTAVHVSEGCDPVVHDFLCQAKSFQIGVRFNACQVSDIKVF